MPCEAAWEEKQGWEVWEGTAAGGEAASKPGSTGPVRPGVGVRSLAPSSRLTQGHRTRRRHGKRLSARSWLTLLWRQLGQT